MTMHLEGPWLSTTGKRKGKQKFRNADQARKARELKEQWEANKAKWDAMAPNFSKGMATVKVPPKAKFPTLNIPAERNSKQYPSRDSGQGIASSPAPKVYTGTKVLGIGTMHKSNMVPIFSSDDAEAIAKMRR